MRFCTEGPAQDIPALESCLLGELAHRTVNDLCCASAAVRLADRKDPDAHQVLDRLAARLDALGALQQMLQAPAMGDEADLAERMTALCQAMVAARYAELGIELRLHIESGWEPIEAGVAWRFLLVVAELLVNAARHAFGRDGGIVRVALARRTDAIVCTVRDDGCGAPGPGAGRPGYGSRVVAMLVQELRGQMRTVSSREGTCAELIVPDIGRLS